MDNRKRRKSRAGPTSAETTVVVLLGWWLLAVLAGWCCVVSIVLEAKLKGEDSSWVILVSPTVLTIAIVVSTVVAAVTSIPAVFLLRRSSPARSIAWLIPAAVIPPLLLGHVAIALAVVGYMWAAGTTATVIFAVTRSYHNDQMASGTLHCRVCGYDVRSTAKRCPECGMPDPADTSYSSSADGIAWGKGASQESAGSGPADAELGDNDSELLDLNKLFGKGSSG